MPKYAENTNVSPEQSRGEIERTLQRYGASHFGYGWGPHQAVVEFAMEDRRVRFILPMPDRVEFRTETTRVNQHHAKDRDRTPEQIEKLWDQATRQRWRAMALVVKAKLEAVEAGITSFEDEFLAHIVLPDNTTVAEHVRPAIAQAYATGTMPELMAGTG